MSLETEVKAVEGEVKAEVVKVEADVKAEVVKVEAEVKAEVAKVEAEVKAAVVQIKAEEKLFLREAELEFLKAQMEIQRLTKVAEDKSKAYQAYIETCTRPTQLPRPSMCSMARSTLSRNCKEHHG